MYSMCRHSQRAVNNEKFATNYVLSSEGHWVSEKLGWNCKSCRDCIRPLKILVITDISLNWTELLFSKIPVYTHRKIWTFSGAAWLKLGSIVPYFTSFSHLIATIRYREFKMFLASFISTIPTDGPNSNFCIRCLCWDNSSRIDSIWRAEDGYEYLIFRSSSFVRVRSFGCSLQEVLHFFILPSETSTQSGSQLSPMARSTARSR